MYVYIYVCIFCSYVCLYVSFGVIDIIFGVDCVQMLALGDIYIPHTSLTSSNTSP